MQQLGDDEFAVREKAHADLAKMGAAVRELEAALVLFSDIEVRTRLRILTDLPKEEAKAAAAATAAPFDTALLPQAKEPLLADAGNEVPVRVEGKLYRLPRRDVVALSTTAPENPGIDLLRPGARASSACSRRTSRVAVSRKPSRPLPTGASWSSARTSRSCSSARASPCPPRSRPRSSRSTITRGGQEPGLSAATHQPLWEGEITIRFCKPGRENVPAGVTHFGCWIAAVVPKGTALIAYDLQGRELGVIHTEGNGNEFLGVRSACRSTPSRSCPTWHIDRDYTLDDFIYTPPQTAEVAHPDRFTGTCSPTVSAWLCGDVSFDGKAFSCTACPGLPDRAGRWPMWCGLHHPGKRRPDRRRPPACSSSCATAR